MLSGKSNKPNYKLKHKNEWILTNVPGFMGLWWLMAAAWPLDKDDRGGKDEGDVIIKVFDLFCICCFWTPLPAPDDGFKVKQKVWKHKYVLFFGVTLLL